MEGPVLTESEVWKVGSGTNTGLGTSDRSIDFSPLMNDNVLDENLTKASENPKAAVQEGICSNTEQQPDPEVTPDQIKSVIPHELQIEEDLSSSQTEVKSHEASELPCKQERCVNQAEEPADKTCLPPDLQDLNQEINQEITILVTNHDCILEDDGIEDFEEQETFTCPTESMTTSSIDSGGPIEEESQDGSIVVANMIEVSQVQKTNVIISVSTEEEPKSPTDQAQEEKRERENRESSNETNSAKAQQQKAKREQSTDSNTPQKMDASSTHANTNAEPRISVEVCGLKDQPTQPEGEEVNTKLKKTESTESKDAGRLTQDTLALTRSPGRQQHVQTQVSLEVMYHSVATSPMTPPEGSAAFLFPSTFGKLANKCSTEVAQTIDTKDAELQVGLQVDTRSVATAPMSPIILTAPEVIPEPEPRIGAAQEDTPEPVQEVSWDEKGMTWEVYGAVVEVAVLGTAIQKHLEKQVKKQKKQPSSLPPSTDASQTDPTETPVPVPSSPPPISDPGECSPAKEQSMENQEKEVQKGGRRRNRFRQWFRNMRRPSCCSRPRQEEDN